MPFFAQTGMDSNAMHDFENTNRGYKSPVSNSGPLIVGSMADADTNNTYIGSASTNPFSAPRSLKSHAITTTSAQTAFSMTSKTVPPFGGTGAYPDKASTSYSYRRPTLRDSNSPTFQDLIEKGRKAQAEDERRVYETKKAKLEADCAKATRARLATDTAVRSLALESRSEIDTCKGKLINDMEKNLRALLESEFRAEIREKVYEDEKKISSTYVREIRDLTRLQLENDLEPVIVAELSVKHEEEVKQTLRAELESEVKAELRAKYKAEFEQELRVELEETVRKELQDMYRDEVRIELKRELSPSVRAELIASLGLQHAVPDLDDLENQQDPYPDRGNVHHLNYNGHFQGYGGESQYDEEEGDDVFDDAPEQFDSNLGNHDNPLNPSVDANDFESSLVVTNDVPNPIIGADQSSSRSTFTGSRNLKRHIDEDYDESDEEEHSDVDCPAEKKVKITPYCDLTADEGSSSANDANGDYRDEQVRNDGAQYGERNEDGDYPKLNDNVTDYGSEERPQKDGEEEGDGHFFLPNGDANAYYGEEQLQDEGGKKDDGQFPSVGDNANVCFGEEESWDANGQKVDRYIPSLIGNAYGNGTKTYPEEPPQKNEDQYEGTQYETYEEEEDGNAGYQDQASKANAFNHDEERDSEEEDSEEDSEEENGDDSEEEGEDDREGDDGDDGLVYGRAQEPLGTNYRGRQINGADRYFSCATKHYHNGEDDEDLADTGLTYGRVQQPFGNHYGETQINDAPHIFSRGMKHLRSEGEDEEEDYEAHGSKRQRGESYLLNEDEYSEIDSMEDESESEGQDAQGGNTYGLIKESNTQETAIAIDSSDDEDNSEAVDEEKTLVDGRGFLSSKIDRYVEESHFLEI